MKKLLLLWSIALVLGTVLIVLPTGKTAHATPPSGGGCQHHNGIPYTVDASPAEMGDPYIIYGPGSRTVDTKCATLQA